MGIISHWIICMNFKRPHPLPSRCTGLPYIQRIYYLCVPHVSLITRGSTVYALLEHSVVSTLLEFRAAHCFIFMLSAGFSLSERQRHLVGAVSDIVPTKHKYISEHFPVVSLCLSIGQTSPVKSLKPVSWIISFFPISLQLLPMGTRPTI